MVQQFGLRIHSYALMPNHYHLQLARITQAVAKVWREPWETASRRQGDPAREVAVLIGRRYVGMSLRQIGEAIRDLSYPAVSDAVRRITMRLEMDRSLQKRLKQVLRYLNL